MMTEYGHEKAALTSEDVLRRLSAETGGVLLQTLRGKWWLFDTEIEQQIDRAVAFEVLDSWDIRYVGCGLYEHAVHATATTRTGGQDGE